MRDRFEIVSNEPTLPWRGTSAGGGYTTAADLMKFADALMSNKLLKAETLAEATRPQFTTGAYGFGFQIGRLVLGPPRDPSDRRKPLPERFDLAMGTVIAAAVLAIVSAFYLPAPLMALIRAATRVVWEGA